MSFGWTAATWMAISVGTTAAVVPTEMASHVAVVHP